MSETTPNDPKIGPAEQSRGEAELIGRIIQSEQKLTDYFTTIIIKNVTDQLERRAMMRLRIIGLVVASLLTVAIPGVMSWVRGAIVEQTETAMDTQFEQATADLERRFTEFLDQERMYSSFTNYLLYLSDRVSIPRSELTDVRLRLEALAKYPAIIERTEFPYLLDLVAQLAVNHSDTAMLDLLESEFDPFLTSTRSKPRLARYYGERVLGDRFTSEAKRRDAAGKFQRYVDASEHSSDFETLLPLQLMVDDHLNAEVLDTMFEGIRLHVRDLGPQDQSSFIAETVRYSNPEFWESATTARSRRIASVAGELVIDHRDFYIELLDNVAVQTALIDIAETEANKGNDTFAAALSGFRNAFSGELASTDDVEFRSAIDALVRTDINVWMHDPVIIEALKEQNHQTAHYSNERVAELESQWQSEFQSGAYDLIEEVMEQPVSRLLRRVKRDSVGAYREIYVMDGIGLLVGASDPNNDYWQGEEEKWLKTYKTGAMHVGTLSFDESALAWVIQISLPILDPESGKTVGALTVGLDPSMLDVDSH